MHNHRSHLKSSFHVDLRYALFQAMCHNNEELTGFKEHIVATLCAKPGTRDEKYLVAVKYDGVVVCYHSSDFTLLQDIWSMNPESEVFFRWKVFTDKNEALSYHQAVSKMDLTKLLPPSPKQKSLERYVKSFLSISHYLRSNPKMRPIYPRLTIYVLIIFHVFFFNSTGACC